MLNMMDGDICWSCVEHVSLCVLYLGHCSIMCWTVSGRYGMNVLSPVPRQCVHSGFVFLFPQWNQQNAMRTRPKRSRALFAAVEGSSWSVYVGSVFRSGVSCV